MRQIDRVIQAGLVVALFAIAVTMCYRVVQAQAPQPPVQGPTVVVPGQPPAVNPNQPSTAAVQTQEVPSPAVPAHFIDQTIWALLGSFGYEYLKKCGWFNWIRDDMAGKIKARLGFALAVLTAAGVNIAVHGTIWDGGTATLTWAGLSWSILKDVAYQWGAQQALYLKVVKEG